MQTNKAHTKTIIIIGVIIFAILAIVWAMFWYYNQYISSLNNQSTQTTTTNSPLLPTLTDNTTDTFTSSPTETTLSTNSILDNLNNVETYDPATEILQGAKVVTLEDKPIAGYTILSKQLSTSSPKQVVARYVLKTTGEMIDYDVIAGSKSSLNTFKPGKTEQALFSKNGDYVVLQSDNKGEIISRLVYVPTNSTYALDTDITSMDFLDNGNLVYGVKKGDGYSVKMVDINTKKAKELVVLQMTEWTLENAGGNIVRATFKPSGYAEGVALAIDIRNGTITNDVKPVIGLTSKRTSDNKYVLLSEGGIGYNKLLFMKRSTQDIFSLNANTFLEKCAREVLKGGVLCAVPEKLDKQAVYPDTWYKNLTNTKDKLVYKSLTSTSSRLVYSFGGANVSVTNLSLTNVGVFFQDTQTLGLYTIR